MSGNIHVALGKSVQRDGKLVHEFNIEDIGWGRDVALSVQVDRSSRKVMASTPPTT